MKRFNWAAIIAIVTIGTLLAAPAVADHRKHHGYYDNHGVRVFPSDRRWHNGYYNHRRAPRPFDRRHWRRGHGYFKRHSGYYPRANPRPVFVQPRHFNTGFGGYHDHFHRNRPLLQVNLGIDRYIHCPDHGGYFFRDDIFHY